jgi:8-oxo-dGTP diphosphatase
VNPELKPVRPSVKAIIVRDDHLLVVVNRNPAGQDVELLPGGGQEPQESLPEALQRECLEEIRMVGSSA